jgi:hypothetical protein
MEIQLKNSLTLNRKLKYESVEPENEDNVMDETIALI